MSDQNYGREVLDKMNRLQLRRICKELGMSSDDAAKAHSDRMIAFILDAQGDDPGEKTTMKKTTKKTKETEPEGGGAKGKDKLAAKRGRKPPSRGKAKDQETDPDVPENTGEVEIGTSELMTWLSEQFDEIKKRIDTIGEVVDQNFQDLTGDVGELRVDNHQLKAAVCHTYKHLQSEEILTEGAAPNGMDIDDVLVAAEEECSGNEEPSGDE